MKKEDAVFMDELFKNPDVVKAAKETAAKPAGEACTHTGKCFKRQGTCHLGKTQRDH